MSWKKLILKETGREILAEFGSGDSDLSAKAWLLKQKDNVS
jgi:hypothetical protein